MKCMLLLATKNKEFYWTSKLICNYFHKSNQMFFVLLFLRIHFPSMPFENVKRV